MQVAGGLTTCSRQSDPRWWRCFQSKTRTTRYFPAWKLIQPTTWSINKKCENERHTIDDIYNKVDCSFDQLVRKQLVSVNSSSSLIPFFGRQCYKIMKLLKLIIINNVMFMYVCMCACAHIQLKVCNKKSWSSSWNDSMMELALSQVYGKTSKKQKPPKK